MIQVGDVLRGRYRIDASIGRGGMGEVFAAVTIDPAIVYDESVIPGRRVAVKVVTRQVLGNVLMARLQREAIAAFRVKSEFVPQMLDVDTTEDGEVFLVMELLRGQTLAERLRQRGGSITWDELDGAGEDVLRALIDAHAAGVIHRDLKPSNIFIETRRGPGGRERARILDFGVCKLDTIDEEKLTTTGEAVGTVAYMAPEQVRGASKVDKRADLYSFASVVFEALAGRLPHEGPGQMALLASKLERQALRLKDIANAPFPPGLDPLIARLLSRNPDERCASAEEVYAAWTTLGPPTTEAPTLPTLRVDELVDNPHPSQSGMTSGTGTMTRLGRKPSRLGVALGLGAVVVSGAVLALMANERAPATVDPGGVTAEVLPPVVPPRAPAPAASEPPLPSSPPLTFEPVASAAPVDADASVLAAPSARPARSNHPPRGAIKRAAAQPTTSGEPHISDKPRY